MIKPVIEGINHTSSANWYDVIRQYHEQGFNVFVDADNTVVDNAPVTMTATLGNDTINYVKNIPKEDCDISSARIHSNRLSIYNMAVGMSLRDALSTLGIRSYNKGTKVIHIPGLLSPQSRRKIDVKYRLSDAALSSPLLQSDVWVMVGKGIIIEISISEDDNE